MQTPSSGMQVAPHLPLVQIPEQHSAALVHVSAVVWHVRHVPPTHDPTQHWPDCVQPSPTLEQTSAAHAQPISIPMYLQLSPVQHGFAPGWTVPKSAGVGGPSVEHSAPRGKHCEAATEQRRTPAPSGTHGA